MAIKTVTFEDKQNLNTNPDIARINKVIDEDINELKDVANTNANNVGDMEQLNVPYDNVVSALNGIAEIVTNDNGTAIKYDNGIMICYGSVSGTSTNSSFYSYLYRLAENLIINLPETFSEAPIVNLTPAYTSSVFACPINSISTTQVKFTPIKASNTGTTYTVYYTAIGKWK